MGRRTVLAKAKFWGECLRPVLYQSEAFHNYKSFMLHNRLLFKKIFLSFLDEIPDDKLEGFPPQKGQTTLYTQKEQNGQNYRLDKQGVYLMSIQSSRH